MWLKRPWPYEVLWSEGSEPAAVAVYVGGRGGLEGKGVMPWLVVAVWSDGRVVSSEDQVLGGSPYFRSQIDPEAAAGLIHTLTALAIKSSVASITYQGPPDYAMTIMQFHTADGRLYGLSSWHELVEEGGDRVVTERGGVELKRGQSAEQVLRANSGYYYMKFRLHWSELRRVISDAIPQKKAVAPDGIVRFAPVQRVD
jgi:hypothetical protein